MNALKKETIKDHIVLFKQKIYLLFSLFEVRLKILDVATVCSLSCHTGIYIRAFQIVLRARNL